MYRLNKCVGVIFVYFFLFSPHLAFTQSIPIGSLLDEQAKLQSLLSDSLLFANVNQPISSGTYHQVMAGNPGNAWWNRNLLGTRVSIKEKATFGLYPIFVQNTVNSKFPYGENNQAAWYGRGNTSEFMGGGYITSRFLTINFYPQIVYQENLDFLIPRFIPRDRTGEPEYVVEGIGNRIDAPFRFGPDPFTTIDLGYSSIRLHFKKIELGLSSEPLWWGPAAKYPLVFSNNAPGVPHFFFSSREPVKLPFIGKLHFSWILGYPQESKYYDGENEGQTRFMNAINIAYQPNFFKNLTVGFTRVYHMYELDGFDFRNVTVLFDPISRSSFNNSQGEQSSQDRNQMASFYARLVLPEANAEIYGEFFREDHSYDFRDYLNQPHHNAAYAFGFQKISYIPWVDFIKTNLEFTNLTTSQLRQVRPQTYIYSHSANRQGHTNNGQILGAAIGPGSNSQYLAIDAYKGNYKLGLFAQRWVDNDNFHFIQGSASLAPSDQFGDYFRHRVNLNFGMNFLYGPGPVYLHGKLMWTKAFNYGRFDYGKLDGVNVRNYEHKDLINVHFQVGITYQL